MGLFDFFARKEEQRRRAISDIIMTCKRILHGTHRARSDVNRFAQLEARIRNLEDELKRMQRIEDKKRVVEELQNLIIEEKRTSQRILEEAAAAERAIKKQKKAAKKLRFTTK